MAGASNCWLNLFCNVLLVEDMDAEKSLLHRELEDSSSNNDDYFIFSLVRIMHTHLQQPRRHGSYVQRYIVIYQEEKAVNKE